ncbi:hypothetical protein RHSIM_Rhsim12G0100000 [Rhododendron simsii]|uniref:Endonuclease/exonuclease/phosphatase domain-containing protein n=1 Tax=Rhododendron simsii TaxID=118357 RepID=A0A834L9L0_RHOSS|nr:hypothetical protein RHSIM_Rhsim12G0100000 [Rhododendron simsii]
MVSPSRRPLARVFCSSPLLVMATVVSGNEFNSAFPPLGLHCTTSALKLGLSKPVVLTLQQRDSNSLSKVNLIDVLEGFTISNNDHLEVQAIDSPTDQGTQSVGGLGLGMSWKDKVSPPSEACPKMNLQFFPPEVEGSEGDPNTFLDTSGDRVAPKESVMNVPCSNQFLSLQTEDNLIDDATESEKGMVSSPCGDENKPTSPAPNVVAAGNNATSITLPEPRPCIIQEGSAAFDFLPALDVGLQDPDVVFQALSVLEEESSKKACEGGNLGVGKRRKKTKHKWKENMAGAMLHCLPSNWDFVHNGDFGPVSRIVVAWNKQGSIVRKLFSSDQMILLPAEFDMKSFVISVVYGSNKASSRRQLWDDLRLCFGSFGHQPWILVGDFNTVRRHSEKSDSTHFDASSALDFNNCLEDVEMEDLNSKGLWFTWSNKRTGHDQCSSRLDRAIVNSHWQSLFTESEAAFLVPGISDHCPVVFVLPYQGGHKPFKFLNFWMSHKGFAPLLLQSWEHPVEVFLSPMLVLYKKLRRL